MQDHYLKMNLQQLIRPFDSCSQKHVVDQYVRDSIVCALLNALNEKDTGADDHAQRLLTLSSRISIKLGLSSNQTEDLSMLALLHDIGKIGISRSILQKPAPLTAEEWAEMKQHPQIGCRIVQALPELSGIDECILYHHERWDGKGYPMGLKGEDIPLLCRIISVIDAYDAMTNDRVYRRALCPSAVFLELQSNAGTQFDADIVHIFLDMLRSEPGSNVIPLQIGKPML
jgi:diguanylate cyclase